MLPTFLTCFCSLFFLLPCHILCKSLSLVIDPISSLKDCSSQHCEPFFISLYKEAPQNLAELQKKFVELQLKWCMEWQEFYFLIAHI